MKEHVVAVCTVCGSMYDIDYNPPLYCHDDEVWEVYVVEATDWKDAIEQTEQLVGAGYPVKLGLWRRTPPGLHVER